MTYKYTSEAGMFDQEFTLEALIGTGKTLSALKVVLDFEQFRPILEPVFAKENRKSAMRHSSDTKTMWLSVERPN